jgi:hypothetical protein
MAFGLCGKILDIRRTSFEHLLIFHADLNIQTQCLLTLSNFVAFKVQLKFVILLPLLMCTSVAENPILNGLIDAMEGKESVLCFTALFSAEKLCIYQAFHFDSPPEHKETFIQLCKSNSCTIFVR